MGWGRRAAVRRKRRRAKMRIRNSITSLSLSLSLSLFSEAVLDMWAEARPPSSADAEERPL